MKIVIQRVKKASVEVNNEIIGKINYGMLIFFGVSLLDTEKEVKSLVEKVVNLRIFPDKNDKMNLSIKEIDGEILVVSQFTLYADCKKGRRPSFFYSAKPEIAKRLYDEFVLLLEKEIKKVETGKFQEYMKVGLVNDGPATFVLESQGVAG